MILVDTNVVSETMKAQPNQAVSRWLDSQAASTLFISSISLGELLLGVAILPTGRRKQGLTEAVNAQMDSIFGGRILSFDEKSARAYASLASQARSSGYTISVGDGMIAAIASAHQMRVATRDVSPFAAVKLRVINPWVEAAQA